MSPFYDAVRAAPGYARLTGGWNKQAIEPFEDAN